MLRELLQSSHKTVSDSVGICTDHYSCLFWPGHAKISSPFFRVMSVMLRMHGRAFLTIAFSVYLMNDV